MLSLVEAPALVVEHEGKMHSQPALWLPPASSERVSLLHVEGLYSYPSADFFCLCNLMVRGILDLTVLQYNSAADLLRPTVALFYVN